jgi:hypothetical protein
VLGSNLSRYERTAPVVLGLDAIFPPSYIPSMEWAVEFTDEFAGW